MLRVDLNIWDKLGYETDYNQEGWVITPYAVDDDQPFGSGPFFEEWAIELSEREASRLTLGRSEQDGGDYAPDADFWLDIEGFFDIYKDIPNRVAREVDLLVSKVEGYEKGRGF
tara:strand:+ start:156 stop:497 length:342 start_codon:yes stop_codon:yes gene_type:complete